jgi:peptidoglycan/xylan/chitin deacetylase (PgdA/CDA1 family)
MPAKHHARERGLGTFVISLDFELHWGVRDRRTIASYRDNLLGVRRVVPSLLALFSEFEIRATWATVGFLFFETRDELLAAIPTELPQYADMRLDPYAALREVGNNEAGDPFHFAPSLIRMIQASPYQEIASHTFSHFYTQAAGPSLESFRADMRAAKAVAQRWGIDIKSIVFPRNQVSPSHIRICAEEGLLAYRGVESDPYVAAGSGIVARAKRLADVYVDLSGPGCGTAAKVDGLEIVSVPQSRFLRPYCPSLRQLNRLHLERIFSSMTFAARNDRLFHLWWHPHNFGVRMEQNLDNLRAILQHYRFLQREFGFESRTMGEVAMRTLSKQVAACPES